MNFLLGSRIVGVMAIVFLSLTFVPQCIKTYSSKKTSGVSAISFSSVFTAMSLVFFWAAFRLDKFKITEIFVAHVVACILLLIILFFIYRNLKRFYLFYIALSYFIIIFTASLCAFTLKVNGHYLTLDSFKLTDNFAIRKELNGFSVNDLIFLVAGTIISLSFLAQMILSIKTKKAENVSLYSSITFILTNLAWAIFFTLNLARNHYQKDFSLIFGIVKVLVAIIWYFPLLAIKYKEKRNN